MEDERAKESKNTRKGIIVQSNEIESMADNEDFLVHLRKLINRTDCSDVEFICEDGVHVHASRIFLTGRSSMLDTMLTNGMRETNSSVINLPEICSAAFLSILEFLYTGSLRDYQPSNWKMALEIIKAADFFLLQDVDKMAKEYLWTQISNIKGLQRAATMKGLQRAATMKGLQRAATMLTVALEFKCVHHDDTALLRLVYLLDKKWVHEDCVCNLSEEAVDFIMRHTKPKMEDRLELSLDEYFRFRGVLLWCLFNSSFVPRKEALKLVNQAMPLTTDELYRKGAMDLSDTNIPTWSDKNDTQDLISRFFVLHQGHKQTAIRLLTHIDWVRIPPRLFMRIIEPLKLVSDSQLLDVFRFHSLHRQMNIG